MRLSLLAMMLAGVLFTQTYVVDAEEIVVEKGETVFSISRKYGVSQEELIALNGISNPDYIEAGQTLTVPDKEPVRAEPSYRGSRPNRGERIAERAKSYVGVRYVWGGSTPDGWDCSGALVWIARQEGLELPRYIPSLLDYPHVSEPLPGDVLIYRDTYRNGISHVGIYVGNDRFFHALSESYGSIISVYSNPYWQIRLVAIVRP